MMGYYLAVKGNEAVTRATTWMNVRVESDRGQSADQRLIRNEQKRPICPEGGGEVAARLS